MTDRLYAAGRAARRRPRLLLLAAVALLALGGAAGAASSGDEISACYQKQQGQLRVIDAEAGQTCRTSEVPLTWNAEGPQGPAGAPGPQGATGPRGPSHAFSRFHDAEVAVGDLDPPRLLELPVPAGKYVTTGTVILRNAAPGTRFVRCETRHPSGDFDVAVARLASVGLAGDTQTLAMNPVGLADGTSPIHLDCHGPDGIFASWMKITSIQVDDLTNTPG